MRCLLILLFSGGLQTYVPAQARFHKIPAQNIHPYKILEYVSQDYKNEGLGSVIIQVQPFEISEQIKYREYKKFLAEIKKDSSENFYQKQLPSFYDAGTGILLQYIQSDIFDDRPVAGISYEAAFNYCKWKTAIDFKENDHLYKITGLNEWIAAYNFLDSSEILHDFNSLFADWTTAMYYEGGFSMDKWPFNMPFEYKENDPPRMKRKILVGRSFIKKYQTLYQSTRTYEYGFNGLPDVSFRMIKVPADRNNQTAIDIL